MNRWTWIRVVAVAAGFLAGIFTPFVAAAEPPIEWQTLIVMLIGSVAGLIVVIWFQHAAQKPTDRWDVPSWRGNPFRISQPLSLFHFLAYVFAAQGIGAVVQLLSAGGTVVPEALAPIALGLGVLVGIKLCARVFRSRMNLALNHAMQPTAKTGGG